MVAVKGAPNLPAIRSTEDLRKALRHLNSITSREILVKLIYRSTTNTNNSTLRIC